MSHILKRGQQIGFLVICLAACQLAYGQSNMATVYGNVLDPSGAAVPNAQVEARNDLTGIRFTGTSNSLGQFTLSFLPVGTYTFTVQAPGFQSQIKSKVPLSAAQTVSLKFDLTISSVETSVTVSAAAALLSSDTAEQHLTMVADEVFEFPLQKKDWSGLLQLGNGITKSSSGVSLNGLPPAGFYLTVDGTNAAQDAEMPSVGFYGGFNTINTVNSEAIAEVSTTKGIAPASVGSSMSGNINLITKSGTNQFHGSLLEINSVAAYGARNTFLATKPGSTFNEFGGSFGGPIIHDKLFFFGNYVGTRAKAFRAVTGTVPTKEYLAKVAAAQPVYTSMLSVLPLPNQPYVSGAQTAQYVSASSSGADDNNAIARIDYYASSRDILTLRYTRARPYSLSPKIVEVNPQATTGHNDTFNAQYTRSEPSWTSQTRFGYNRMNVLRLDEGYGIGLDSISFQGFSTVGAEAFTKLGSIYSWEETIAKNVGRHVLQFGGIVQRNNSGRIDDTTTSFSYSSEADFLANIPNQIQINFPLKPYLLHTYQFGGFVQDDFRATANLTLNLGIRYDYFTVPKERDGRVFVRDANELGPGFGSWRPASQMWDANWANVAPRLGFAWSLGNNRKTVLRGGSGLFYSGHPVQGPAPGTVLVAGNVPFRLTLNRTQALAQGLKFPVDKAAKLEQVKASGSPISNQTINRHFPNPYSIQWMLGLQRDFLGGTILEASYTGNRGLHLNMVRMMNLPDRNTGIAPNPDPYFGQFRYYDGSDASWYNALQVSLKGKLLKGPSLGVYYTYANNMSYGDGDLWLQANPQDNNNLRADKGPTPYDVRHRFNASFLYELPLARWMSLNGRATGLLIGGWQVSGVLTATTGSPVNVTQSTSSYPSSRPDAVSGVNPYLDNYTVTRQYLNSTAFLSVPIIKVSGASARPGTAGRYSLRAPGQWTLDASLAKNFRVTERIKFQLRADFFNALNHTNLGGLTGNVSSSSFGRLTSATPRTGQIGAKIEF
jgi:hypothetical protein